MKPFFQHIYFKKHIYFLVTEIIIDTVSLVDEIIEIVMMIFVNVRRHHFMAGKHTKNKLFQILFFFFNLNYVCVFIFYRRGRGAYRGRGRGNFYRQDRGGMHQMHSMHQQGPNMQPYYNQTSNQIQPSAGVGNYHNANYHDMQANRYEQFNQFTTNFKYHVNEKPKKKKSSTGNQQCSPFIGIYFHHSTYVNTINIY